MSADPQVTAILLDVVDVLGENVAAHVARQHRPNGTRGPLHRERRSAMQTMTEFKTSTGGTLSWQELLDLDAAVLNDTADPELRDRLVRHIAFTAAWIADLDRTAAAGT